MEPSVELTYFIDVLCMGCLSLLMPEIHQVITYPGIHLIYVSQSIEDHYCSSFDYFTLGLNLALIPF